jgi:hypothetical protein
MSTRQERALHAMKQRGIECVEGALVDLTFLIDVLAAADGASFNTVAQLGTPGDHIELKPPGNGSFAVVQVMFEGGESNDGTNLFDASDYLYVGDIRSGDTKDARDVWGGSTGATNRTSSQQLTPDSRLYVNTDPLRVAGLRQFSEKQPLKIALGNCKANDATCVSALVTMKCLGGE